MVDFFRADFLGWLEVLALLGRLSEGMTMLSGLQSLLEDIPDQESSWPSLPSFLEKLRWPRTKKSPNPVAKASDATQTLGELIRDAKRFTYHHSGIIAEVPLQVYCSALLFSPEQSLIRQIYHDQIPNWITPSFQRRDTWSSYTQILRHPQDLRSFAFSPDGKYLASGCEDGTVWLWDVVTGANQRILGGHSDSVYSIAISPDSQLIASGSQDCTIRLWNSTTGAIQRILTHDKEIYRVAFSPDGASLASLSIVNNFSNSSISLWSIERHAEQWQSRVLIYVNDILFLSDGKHVAYSGWGETGLLDAKTGQTVRILAKGGRRICSSNLSTGGQMVGLVTDTHIELYDVQLSARRWRVRVPYAQGIAFSPDDRALSAAFKGRIELLDVASGHTKHVIERQIDGPASVSQITFSSDGTFLASSLSDNTIRFWDMPGSRQQLVPYSSFSEPQDVTTSDCGIFIALMSAFEASRLLSSKVQLYIWDTQGMKMIHAFSLRTRRRVEYMMFSPNCQFLAIKWGGSHYDLFNCKTGKSVIHSNKVGYHRKLHIFSPDSKLLVLRTIQDSIQIWDIQKRATIYEIQVTKQLSPQMAFSLDSKLIAATATDEQLYVFDLGATVLLTQVGRNFIHIEHIQFSHENRLLVTSSWNTQIELLDAHTGRTLRVFKLSYKASDDNDDDDNDGDDGDDGDGDDDNGFQIFQTADIIVTCDTRDTLEVWDLETGALRISLEWSKRVDNIHLLPCKSHLLINETILPLSRPDSSTRCSHTVSVEKLYITRGEEQLVFVLQDYASALIAVRDEGASFQPFNGRTWGISTSSQLINTLKFDFSVNEGFV
jgi:WD40 repeat protein